MTTPTQFRYFPRNARRLLPHILTLIAAILFFATRIWAQAPAQAKTPPALVIVSVDGMKPEYVTHADEHGAKVPNLRQMMQEGAYAEGVQGVVPTVTYPSHTALVTGVWPAKHGILANTLFDPLDKAKQAWYWYAEDIRVPALWDVMRDAGRTTASVQWPVTVGAKITWDIPEVWRAGDENDIKLIRSVSTPGLLEDAEKDLGPYRGGIDSAVEADEVRAKYAEWILFRKKPSLLLLHLLALDHLEHETGLYSKEDLAALQRIDEAIGILRSAAEHAYLDRPVVFAVVSDHGFVDVEKQLNLGPAFAQAGLITLDAKEKVTEWKAFPWATGGSAAIVLKDPTDAPTAEKVRALLKKLASDPANGIDRVLEADDLHGRGGYPSASFFVGLKPGWKNGYVLTGPVVESLKKPGGTHGALNDLPELRSSFFVVGPGVPAGKKFDLIDMRDIAPTLAHLVGLQMPSADGKNLLP